MILANSKHELFAQAVASGKALGESAVAAGYSAKSCGQISSKLAKKSEVSARISELQAKQADYATLSGARVLEELRRLAFADIRTLFDESGNLRPIHTLTSEQAACIGGFEIIKKNAEAGDGVIDIVHKVKVIDKTKSIEMLAKHFALLLERVEHTGDVAFRWKATPDE